MPDLDLQPCWGLQMSDREVANRWGGSVLRVVFLLLDFRHRRVSQLKRLEKPCSSSWAYQQHEAWRP